jgi:helicase MOV-10
MPHALLPPLQVPGLAEKRPSVLKGDALYVVPEGQEGGKREWQGYVHRVERDQVGSGLLNGGR